MSARDDRVEAAGLVLAQARARRDSLTPEEAAAEAYVPGGPSVEELTDRIRAMRAPAAPTRKTQPA
jgi:hypothetical protein